LLVLEVSNGLHRASGPLEGFEDQAERTLHLPVWIEVNHPVRPIDETHWRMHFERAAAGLVELATAHASLEDVQLGFAHGSLEPKQQSVVEACRIVNAILVEDQRGGKCAEFYESVPVG